MPVQVGQEAPDFELPVKPGEAPLRLSDYRGERSVVLLFFPLAFSPICTEELMSVAHGYEEWKALDVEVIGISVDSPFVTEKFARECGAAFPILSDFNRKVSEAYGVKCDDFFGMHGVAHRAAFVVSPEGRVLYSRVCEDPGTMPDFEAIRLALREGAAV